MHVETEGALERALKESSYKNHRIILVLLDSESADPVPTLHSMMGRISGLSSVVWCKKSQSQNKSPAADSTQTVNSIQYSDIDRLIGTTCDVLIFQDIGALAPNIIAKATETVRGGGAIVFLAGSLIQLSNLITDATDSSGMTAMDYSRIESLFLRRAFSLLCSADCALLLGPDLHTLRPLQSRAGNDYHHQRDYKLGCGSDSPYETGQPQQIEDATGTTDRMAIGAGTEDADATESAVIAGLLSLCRTADQKRVLRNFIGVLDKREDAIVSVTAARGRGKSSVIGLAIAYAIYKGLPSVQITALFLENVQEMFRFIVLGLQALGYKQTADFRMHYRTTNAGKMVHRIQMLKSHQHATFTAPLAEGRASPALLVIDEAASIPAHMTRQWLQQGMVFMGSTTSGYEGTGQAFTVKLLSQLKKPTAGKSGIPFIPLTMIEPVRYSLDDPVEGWLNRTLKLDTQVRPLTECPPPGDCLFFHLDKFNLFGGSSAEAEDVLDELASILAGSHYRNSPDDLQLLADSPRHEVFVLCTPARRILCAVHVAFEGEVHDSTTQNKEGNAIPWVIYDNFRDTEFMATVGLRIVRIAVHPQAYSQRYGTETLSRLLQAAGGQPDSPAMCPNSREERATETELPLGSTSAHVYRIFRRTGHSQSLFTPSVLLPPVCWVGASFGLTEKLFNFWKRNGFLPLCIKQQPSSTTGEHSIVMLRPVTARLPNKSDKSNRMCTVDCEERVRRMNGLFISRLLPLIGYFFVEWGPGLCLSLLHAGERRADDSALRAVAFTPDRLERLGLFSREVVSYWHINDTIPDMSRYLFSGSHFMRLPIPCQAAMAMLGLQQRPAEAVRRELRLEMSQLLSILRLAVELVLSGMDGGSSEWASP